MKDYIENAMRTESMDLFKVDSPRLLHASLGVITEICELIESADLDDDDLNAKEELGDVLWYIAIGADELEVTFGELLEAANFDLKSMEDQAPGLVVAQLLGTLADIHKRGCFYGLDTDVAKMTVWLGNALVVVKHVCEEKEISLQDCMKANIAKLTKRYPEKFTTEDAVNRDVDAEMEAVADVNG